MANPPYRRGSEILGIGRRFGRLLRLFRSDEEPEAPVNATAPGPPTNVVAFASGVGAITVTWSAPLNTGGALLSSYTVTPRNVNTGVTLAAVNVSSNSAVITGLAFGDGYRFTVTATNQAGLTSVASDPSNQISTSSIPNVPLSVVAVGGASSLSLSWTAPNSNGLPITGYQLVVKRSSGVTFATISTGTTATTRAIAGLVNDEDYFVEVKAINDAGMSPAPGISNTVNVNWVPVELRMHGGWTSVTHPGGNPLRLRFSREEGIDGGAGGIAYWHIVSPGEISSVLSDDRAGDKLVEGDVVNVVVPLYFPTEDWPAGVTSTAKIFWARGFPNSADAFSIEANNSQIFFKVNGVTRHTRSMQTNTRLTFRIAAKISADPAVGYIELLLGVNAPGSTVMTRITMATLPATETSLILETGLKHAASIATKRRVRHNGVTMTLTRAGVTSRIRLDAEADGLFQMMSATPGVTGTNRRTYANIEAAGTTDRIQLIMNDGVLSWQFRVKSGDRDVGGQRAELVMAIRPTKADQSLPQKRFINGDKIILTSRTWIPTGSLFTFGTTNQWGVEEQFHQIAESGGSPPHEIAIGTEIGGGHYGYRHNSGPLAFGAYSTIDNPALKGQWYNKELTIFVHDDDTIGYVIFKVNGVTKIAKTPCRTNYLVDPNNNHLGDSDEIIGVDIPEQLNWQSGLYERSNALSGFTYTRELIHAEAKIILYRNPAGPSPF